MDYNAMVEATQQKLTLRGCSGQEKTVKYGKAWKIGMWACWTTGTLNKCAMLLSRGGGHALRCGRKMGRGRRAFFYLFPIA